MTGFPITIAGLGPAGLDLADPGTRRLLEDPTRRVILRTLRHPAAAELAGLRQVESADDLYESAGSFEEVYDALADRVIAAALEGPVVFAVPGSPTVGEFTVPRIRARASEQGIAVELRPGRSFLDAICADLGIDPLERGLQVLDGRDLPDTLWLDMPTVIGQVDLPVVLADVADRLDRALAPGTEIAVVTNAGSPDVRIVRLPAADIDPALAGLQTSLVVDAEPGGLAGAIDTMRRLRRQCPWDREQTHHSIVSNLVEEAHELADALSALPPTAPSAEDVGAGAYGEVEDELGDVLLQVLFHVAMGEEVGALRLDDVAETLRRKLVRRHPHVFGEVSAETASEVRRVWDDVKAAENASESLMDGVPRGVPALVRAEKLQMRAARAGFDWPSTSEVAEKVREELDELAAALAGGRPAEVETEIGDLLFTVVNLSRHVGVDPESALRGATEKFERRFRRVELSGPLDGLSLGDLERRWQAAKRHEE